MPPSAPLLLVVEDDVLVRLTLVEGLNDAGFQVVEAEDAAVALEQLAAHGDIAAMLTDINLADGPDGFELARQVRALRPELPVLYVSGRFLEPRTGSCVPGAAFLAKPFAPSLAGDMLHRMIDGQTVQQFCR